MITYNWPEPAKDFETGITHELLKEKKLNTKLNIILLISDIYLHAWGTCWKER